MAWEQQRKIISELNGREYSRCHCSFTQHLREHGMTYKDYYEAYISKTTPRCPVCGKDRTFYRATHSYAKTCGGHKCNGIITSQTLAARDPEKTKKIGKKISKSRKRLWAENYDEMLAAVQATRKLIGEDGLTGFQRITNKGKKTKLQRYGDAHYNNASQISASKQAHSEEILSSITQKRRQTMKEIYGVENNFLRPEVIKRSRKGNAGIKSFEMPSGVIVGVRGYESIVINELLKTYSEDDLVICDEFKEYEIPIVEYVNSQRKHLKYYPDIFIPSENLIIEVKSLWWYNGNGGTKYKSRLENNMKKRQACMDLGFAYNFWIFPTPTEWYIK